MTNFENDPHEVAASLVGTSNFLSGLGMPRAAENNQTAAQMLRDLHEQNAELRAENERLKNPDKATILGNVLKANRAFAEGSDAGGERDYSPDDWLTHDSHNPPADLAAAQLVWLPQDYFVDEDDGPTLRNELEDGAKLPVCIVDWHPGLSYRPALSSSGNPLCSAEGLEPWATHVWVADDGCDSVVQTNYDYERKRVSRRAVLNKMQAPETHRKPGSASQSLMEVDRD